MFKDDMNLSHKITCPKTNCFLFQYSFLRQFKGSLFFGRQNPHEIRRGSFRWFSSLPPASLELQRGFTPK